MVPFRFWKPIIALDYKTEDFFQALIRYQKIVTFFFSLPSDHAMKRPYVMLRVTTDLVYK
jgi:hypothetical protein